ncbi:MAG: hypothetical protein JWM83_415 [Candidatus Angelobacter sp.]|nr:hypothetical protein [Candidatus Angelobacter sp.]
MKTWRMSFRAGNQGPKMWPSCLLFSVAAITYDPLATIDLSMHPPDEPKSLWSQLKPSQKASLHRVVYEMKGGDTIYVKEGPGIIDRGVVQGQIGDRAYRFDSQFRIVDPYRTPWAHQVPVKWSSDFSPVDILVGRSQQFTVEPLATLDIRRLESAIDVSTNTSRNIEPNDESRRDALIEEVYYRETQARSKFIVRYHNKLSNEFCNWLERKHAIVPRQEYQWIDIRFELGNQTMLAELKTCFGVGTRKAIREALGQLLEYNHYPSRETCDQWFIVLDEEPSDDDRRYIEILRKLRSLPLTIGWRTKKGFDFYPAWSS